MPCRNNASQWVQRKANGKRQGEREMLGEGRERCCWCPEQLQAAVTSADQRVCKANKKLLIAGCSSEPRKIGVHAFVRMFWCLSAEVVFRVNCSESHKCC